MTLLKLWDSSSNLFLSSDNVNTGFHSGYSRVLEVCMIPPHYSLSEGYWYVNLVIICDHC
jgi:hypothetical protein